MEYDAIIVGTGLSGSWAAKELCETGLNVLVLDAGPALDARDAYDTSALAEKCRQDGEKRQWVQRRHSGYWSSNPKLFVDDIDNPFYTNTDFVWIRGRQVGGRSLTWGGVMLRFSDYEFLAPEHDGFGPKWPLTYAELAPFYSRVEDAFGVIGNADGLDVLPDGSFLSKGELTEAELEFKATVERAWPDRSVIQCRGIEHRERNPDRPWQPKTTLDLILPAAISTGRITLRPGSVVSHLLVDRDTADVTGVAVIDAVTRQSCECRAPAVVLCASSIESVRIMLNSKTRQHPRGVGNSSGLLGCGITDHIAVSLMGTIPSTRGRAIGATGGPNAICIPRFRNVGVSRSRFIRGYGIWGGLQRNRVNGSHDAGWWLTSVLEVLPRDENCIAVDASRTDAWGVKIPKISLAYGENEHLMKHDSLRCMLEMVERTGLDVQGCMVSKPGQFVHELGGARMGSDPRMSVVNRFNQCWDAPSLFVLDGAVFPTAGWQNPSLTIMALAVRACTYIEAA